MNNYKIIVMIMMLGLVQCGETFAAIVQVQTGDKLIVHNKTTGGMLIKVVWITSSETRSDSSADEAVKKASGFIPADQFVELPFLSKTYKYIEVRYFKDDKSEPIQTIKFSPLAQGKELYVYGSGDVVQNQYEKDTAGNLMPARYVAWWTSDINTNTAGYTDIPASQKTINAMTTAKPVTIYAIDPRNIQSIIAF